MENNKTTPSPIYLAIARKNYALVDSLLEWTNVTPEMLNYTNSEGMSGLLDLLLVNDKDYSFLEKYDKEELAIKLVEAGADVLYKAKPRYSISSIYGGSKEMYGAINVAVAKNKEKFFSYLVNNNKITKQNVLDSFDVDPFLYAQTNGASGAILELLKTLGIAAPDSKEAWKNITGISQLEYLKTQPMPEFGFNDALTVIKSIASNRKILDKERLVIVKDVLNIFKKELTKENLKEFKRVAPEILFPLIVNTDEKTFRVIFDFAGKPFLSKNVFGEDLLFASLKAGKLNLANYFAPNLSPQDYNRSGTTSALALCQLYGFSRKDNKIFNSILEKCEGRIEFDKTDDKGYNLLHDFYLKKVNERSGKYFHYLTKSFRHNLLKLVNEPDKNGLTPFMHLCAAQDIMAVKELMDACSRSGVEIDYLKKDKDDVPLLAYVSLLYKQDHSDSIRGKDTIREIMNIPNVKNYIDSLSPHETSVFLLQTMMLSTGQAYTASKYVMNSPQVFARLNVLLDFLPLAKVDASLAIEHWKGFLEKSETFDEAFTSYSILRFGKVEPVFLFMLNDKIGQKEKDLVLEGFSIVGRQGRDCSFELLSMLVETEKIIFPLDKDFMAKYKDNIDFFARLEKSNIKNKITAADNKEIKRLKI